MQFAFWMTTLALAAPGDEPVQFARDVQPILANYCWTCHGPDDVLRKAGLRLDNFEGATKSLRKGRQAVKPGHPDTSELIVRILSEDEDRMPPAKSQKQLKPREIETLKKWIAQGAKYERHWAFAVPVKASLPNPTIKGWAKQPIDRFIAAKLESMKLKPTEEADRYTLARRIALDLTGLPPTLEMADQFVNDANPDALDRYVDAVLAQPSYGERWAQVWLDLARYADSNGYATDNPRTIWRWRDWVIDAFNRNQPYDRFTIEQIAGDLLPDATKEQILATGFHRNTLTNDEGGTNDEEFRAAAVVDRVNTTMQVWMGVTMACAQCHNHKYDPFSQEEYFQLYAILNQTEDSDKGDNSPLVTIVSPETLKKKAQLEADLMAVEKVLLRPDEAIDAKQTDWEKSIKIETQPAKVKAILNTVIEKRTPVQKADLRKFYRETVAVELKTEQKRQAEIQKQIKELPIVTSPILRDLPAGKQRKTKIHVRGNFLDEGKEVKPGVPTVFHALPEEPANRLALAKWLVDPNNPLTARVAVNRFWEQIFGVGLVEASEDYGIRGKLPTHPELLDWLAVEFVESGWDVKKLLKLLVTSATYRQSSKVTPELLEKDPDNRLFARGPRYRASAETIRDQALFISGLFSPKMFGPPVRPPQPKTGLNAAFGPGTDWVNSTGEDRYRRAMYTQWRRTTPYPSMTTFDAPARTVCAVNRPRTNTPLQALVTLNDPVYVEAAQALARKMVKEAGPTVDARVKHGIRLALIRPARDLEVSKLSTLFERARADFEKNAAEANLLATDPLGPLPAGMNAVDLAAWTVVANVLLNLDEVFAKR